MESNYLVLGTILYGNEWAKIKRAFPNQLANRDRENLKDRFRTLTRNNGGVLSEDLRTNAKGLYDNLCPQKFKNIFSSFFIERAIHHNF